MLLFVLVVVSGEHDEGIGRHTCMEATVGGVPWAFEYVGDYCASFQYEGTFSHERYTGTKDPTYEAMPYYKADTTDVIRVWHDGYTNPVEYHAGAQEFADRVSYFEDLYSATFGFVRLLRADTSNDFAEMTIVKDTVTYPLYKPGISTNSDARAAILSMTSVIDVAHSPCAGGVGHLGNEWHELLNHAFENNIPLTDLWAHHHGTDAIESYSYNGYTYEYDRNDNVDNYVIHKGHTCATAPLSWYPSAAPATSMAATTPAPSTAPTFQEIFGTSGSDNCVTESEWVAQFGDTCTTLSGVGVCFQDLAAFDTYQYCSDGTVGVEQNDYDMWMYTNSNTASPPAGAPPTFQQMFDSSGCVDSACATFDGCVTGGEWIDMFGSVDNGPTTFLALATQDGSDVCSNGTTQGVTENDWMQFTGAGAPSEVASFQQTFGSITDSGSAGGECILATEWFDIFSSLTQNAPMGWADLAAQDGVSQCVTGDACSCVMGEEHTIVESDTCCGVTETDWNLYNNITTVGTQSTELPPGTCAAGYALDGQLECQACDATQNEYYPTSGPQTACLTCAVGNIAVPPDAPTACECAPGYAGADGVCTSCAAGEYKVASGDGACVACGAGETTLAPGSSSADQCVCAAGSGLDANGACAACPGNQFKPYAGDSACLLCADHDPNSVAPTAGADVCRCKVGHFLNAETGLCTPCHFATYKPATGNESCTACLVNKNTSTVGAVGENECKCLPGFTSTADAGEASCTACPTGTYQPIQGNAEPCVVCGQSAVGGTTLLSASTTWADCIPEAGYYMSGVNTFLHCPDNTYRGFVISNSPVCTAPTFRLIEQSGDFSVFDSTVIVKRTALNAIALELYGYTLSDAPACDIDPDTGAYAQVPCAEPLENWNFEGWYKGDRSNPCPTCAFPAFRVPPWVVYREDGVVDVHERIWYQENWDSQKQYVYIPLDYHSRSMFPPYGDLQHYLFFGHPFDCATCSACTVNNVLLTMPAEYALESCTACPYLASSPPGSTELTDCTCAGPAYVSSTGVQCWCAAGYYGYNECELCPADFFCDGSEGGTHVQACLDLEEAPAGSSSADACVCVAGAVRDAGSGVCQLCPAGTFESGDACAPCADSTTSAAGAASAANCTAVEGYYQLPDGTVSACPDNMTTIEPGATSATACTCAAGYFDPSCMGFPCATTACEACVAGTHRAIGGDVTACDACPANMTTAAPAATSADACLCKAGYTSTPCEACAVNTYKASLGPGTCDACNTEQLAPSGSTSADACLCPAGQHYRVASEECVACAIGTYRAGGDDSACTACSANMTTISTGGTSASACVCSPGETPSGDVCVSCAEGTYKSMVGNWSCTALMTGQVTTLNDTEWSGAGSTGFTCAAGYHSSNNVSCQLCMLGSFKDSIGFDSCEFCPLFSQSFENLTGCACRDGYVANVSNASECIACPANSYVAVGDTLCTTCAQHAYAPAGSYSAAQCECGTGYSGVFGSSSRRLLVHFAEEEISPCNGVVVDGVQHSYRSYYTDSHSYYKPDSSAQLSSEAVSVADAMQQCASRCAALSMCLSFLLEAQQNAMSAQCILYSAAIPKTDWGNGLEPPRPNGDQVTELTNEGISKFYAMFGSSDDSDESFFMLFFHNQACTSVVGPITLTCTPCEAGTFKDVVANTPCSECPTGAWSDMAATACACLPGYTPLLVTVAVNPTHRSSQATAEYPIFLPYFNYGRAVHMARTFVLSFLAQYYPDIDSVVCNSPVDNPPCKLSEQVDNYAIEYSEVDNPSLAFNYKVSSGVFIPETGGILARLYPNPWASTTEFMFAPVAADDPYTHGPSGYDVAQQGGKVFIFLTASNDCVACPADTYKTENGSATCTPCPEFTSHTLTGSETGADCVCDDGYTGDFATGCTACPAGSYRPVDTNECAACPGGTVTSGATGASDLDAACLCAPGTTGLASTGCGACPVNTFQPTAGGTTCEPCPEFSISPAAATSADNCTCDAEYVRSTEPTLTCELGCPAGYSAGPADLECFACSAGTYKPTSGSGACLACPEHSTHSLLNASSVDACLCAQGFVRAPSWPEPAACDACEAGTFNNRVNSTVCHECYAEDVNNACTPDATQNTTACVGVCQVPAGQGAIAVFGDVPSNFAPCEPGTWNDGAYVLCQPCPTGTTHDLTGATSVAACYCMPGYSLTGAQCSACASGTYKPDAGNDTACVACPSGATSPAGATGPEQCVCAAGYGTEGSDASACAPCAEGTQKFVDSNEPCIACPADSTLLTNSTHASESCVCQPGFTGSADACTPCAPGTYKTEAGSAACTVCGEGLTSPEGATTAAACECDGPSYLPDPLDPSICIAACGVGEFFDGDNTCALCAENSYKETVGNEACTPCPEPHTRGPEGSSNVSNCVCPVGAAPLNTAAMYRVNILALYSSSAGTNYDALPVTFDLASAPLHNLVFAGDDPYIISLERHGAALALHECESTCAGTVLFDANTYRLSGTLRIASRAGPTALTGTLTVNQYTKRAVSTTPALPDVLLADAETWAAGTGARTGAVLFDSTQPLTSDEDCVACPVSMVCAGEDPPNPHAIIDPLCGSEYEGFVLRGYSHTFGGTLRYRYFEPPISSFTSGVDYLEFKASNTEFVNSAGGDNFEKCANICSDNFDCRAFSWDGYKIICYLIVRDLQAYEDNAGGDETSAWASTGTQPARDRTYFRCI